MTTTTTSSATNNPYVAGDIAILTTGSNGFVDTTTGLAADPSTLTLKIGIIGAPATSVSYVYGVGSVIVKDSVGNYHADIDTTGFEPGVWTYEWIGVGGAQAVGVNQFNVTAPPL